MRSTQSARRIQQVSVGSVKALIKTIETRDTCTEGHSFHVADLTVRLARSMGLRDRILELLEFAGLLHDVGKIAAPEDILKKTSALNEAEWNVIKKHTVYSSEIIESIACLRRIRDWVLYHHERWDGQGYPAGIKGKAIPLPARILSVCDAYSAMTSNRPYRKALGKDFALNELKNAAGSQFDPAIVQAFIMLEQPSKISAFQEGRNTVTLL